MRRILGALALGLVSWLGGAHAWAQEPLLVEKRTMTIPRFSFVSGATLADVKVGYETFGTLNAAGDNAILVPRTFSTDSHVAGRYKASDAAPGYWDAIVGPGKAIDTNRFFVVATDNLANLATKNPTVVTTGPATVDPATGKPYGLRFPIYQVRDMVNLDKAVLDALGVKHLHAVVGASMGSFQTFEWAASYPDFVDRIVPVLPTPQADGFLIGWLAAWQAPILADLAWKGGDYYGGPEPAAGLAAAMKVAYLQQRWAGAVERTAGLKPADPAKDPAASWDARYAIEQAMDADAQLRVRLFDANAILYGAKAMQISRLGGAASLEEGLAKIRAKALVIPAKTDMLLWPYLSQRAVSIRRAQGRE
ncbi:MAG: homoserine O-acetyltransferase, partial [Methylobacteriaceae bacterium]|nr:homoserine O-acetyltransferase [Methylobacteriaceae bacterium]